MKCFKCKVCGIVIPAGLTKETQAVKTHIARQHPASKPVEAFFELTEEQPTPETLAKVEQNRRTYEIFKQKREEAKKSMAEPTEKTVSRKRTPQQIALNASTGYIDLPVTIRVYLSAIGSVGSV